jgi:DNA-binding NarL/FixJ family response regulator
MTLPRADMPPEAPSPIRVVIADDHPITRAGLRSTLEALPDIVVVGEASDGAEALRLVKELTPDVLLLDVEMPRMTGVEVAERLKAMHAPVRVLALSAYDDEAYVHGLLDSGAAGYLVKEETQPERLVEALEGIVRDGNELWISRRLATKLIRRRRQPETPANLTERQEEVLRLVALGYDNQRVADLLHLSKDTIKNHIDRIKQMKISVRTRAELIAWAWQHGLVKPGDEA